MNEQTLEAEKIVLDFDGWLGGVDSDTRGMVQSYLNAVPEGDRGAKKQKLASMFAVAESTGIDLPTINDRWDVVRGGFAEREGGEWMDAKTDDGKFFGQLQRRATQQRDERQLLYGPDEYLRRGANSDVSNEGQSDAPKAKAETLQGSLFFKAQEAAYAGKTYADALSEWQSTASGRPGFLSGRLDEHTRVAREAWQQMNDSLAKVRPVAQQAFDSLAIDRGVKDGGNTENPISLFRGMTPQEKNLAFRIMGDMAKSNPEKSRTQAFFEAAGRGFENLLFGGGAAGLRSKMLSTHFAEGDQVTRNNPLQEVMADYMTESAGLDSDAFELGRNVEKLGGRKLTAEEAADWNKQLDAAREDLDTAEQLRIAGQNIVDPTRVGDPSRWYDYGFQKVLLPAADSAALMGSMMIPGAAAPAFELRAKSYQNEEYMRLRDSGMDARSADRMAAVTGLAQSALDQVEIGVLAKGMPKTFSALKQFAYTGNAAGRFLMNAGGTVLAETAIELTQDHIVPALVQDNSTNDPQFDVHWGDVWREVASAAPETALGMLLLSGVGGAFETHAQGQWAKYTEQMSGSPASMRLKGYTMEQIAEIQAAPEMWQKGELLRQYDPSGLPAPTGEAQAALVRDVVDLARKEKKTFAQKQAAETVAAAEAADYTIRVTRTDAGWQVTKADGSTVAVNSAEAARSIREDLMQAATQEEAEAMVSIAEDWHSKAPQGTQRETSFTGETATSDGQKITYTRPGVGVVREITDARTLDTLREEARMEAEATGNSDIDVVVHGLNSLEFRERLGEDVKRIVQRLEINQSDTPALTVVHERAEAVWRAGIATGAITREETQRAVASIAEAFDPTQARDSEEQAFRERVQRVARGEASEAEIRETVSELTVADVLGRRKDGRAMPAGSITAAVNAMINRRVSAEDARAVGKFRAMLRGVRQYFRALFGTVAAIKKAKREGGGQDFEALVNKVLGLDELAAHDKATAEEAEAIANEAGLEYRPPTEEEQAAGIAFSVSPARVDEWAKLERAGFARQMHAEEKGGVRWKWFKEQSERTDVPPVEQQLRDWAESVDLTYDDNSEIRRLKPDDILFGSDLTPEADVLLTAEESERFVDLATEDEPTPEQKAELDQLMRKVKAGLVAGRKLWEKFQEEDEAAAEEDDGGDGNGPAQMEMGFRVSAGSRLELIQKQLDAALARDPKKRRELGRVASEKLQKLQFELETERYTPQGDRIRPVVEQRTKLELDKEQAFRQASRTEELITEGMAKLSPETLAAFGRGVDKLEDSPLIATMLGDHGKLISKATAARRGLYGEYDGAPWLPPKWYAGYGKGGLMPDEMAQALCDDGRLREPSPDALWKALEQEIKTHRNASEAFEAASKAVREVERQARNKAREEAAEWRREQDQQQSEDWNLRTALVRDLRTLEALASVLPPEIRGKLGGFSKLARLGSNEARLKEIQERVKKMGVLVEQHLQSESVKALEDLLQKAKPKGGPGERPGGKIGVSGHRIFAQVERVWLMTEEEALKEQAALTAAIEKEAEKSKPGEVNQRLLDLLEQEQIFDMFANFDSKSAAAMDKAIQWLSDVYKTGRNAWRAIEEQRAAEIASMQARVIEDIGGDTLAARQEQKKSAPLLPKMLENGSLDLISFVQVLESLLAPGHELVKRWNQAARTATAQKTDAILSANARFAKATRAAFGDKSQLEIQRQLWSMATEQRIKINKREGGASETIEVPREKVEQLRDGTADPATLGVTAEEVADLVAQLDDIDNMRKKLLRVERINPGEIVPANITEGEAIALTMLARQEQYAANLAHHGYTAEVLEQAEKGISDAGRSLREFFAREYREGYEPLARLFREMFGIDLPQIANYSPASFYHAGKERASDPFGGGLLPEGGFRSGFLKERKAHLAEPRMENAFSVWRGHVAQTQHWQAFAPLVRELKSVFGNAKVRNAIQSNHGTDMVGAMQNWIMAFEQNGLHERQLSTVLDGYAREIARRQATLTLTWKAGTVLKQTLAVFSSAARMPLGAYLRGFSRVMAGTVDVKAIYDSPMIQRRIESGYSPEVRAAMVSLFNGKPTAFKEFVLRGMELLGEVDAFFTSIGTAIAYDHHLNEGRKAGLSEEEAQKQALIEAEDVLGRTAQPTEMMDRGLYELGMSPLERIGFMFASNQRKDTALIISAVQQWKAGKISKGEMVRVLTVAWLATGLGSALIGAAWRDAQDDDDDSWLDWEHWSPLDLAKQTLLGPLGGIPLLNLLASSFQGFSNSGPFQPVARGIAGAASITEGDKAEPVEKTVNRVVDVLNGAAMLIPQTETAAVGGNIFKQLFNLVDNFTPDTKTEADRKEHRREAQERKQAK